MNLPQVYYQLPQVGHLPLPQMPQVGHQLPQVIPYPFQLPQNYNPLQLPQVYQLIQQTEEQKEQNKINISKKEISDLLTQDSYYRKLKEWPLLTLDDISIYHRWVDEMFTVNSDRYNGYNAIKISDIQNRYNDSFPNIDKLLLNFNGHLVACGGAVVKSIFRTRGGDIDLFFYDLTIEDANKMRLDAIEFLINLWEENDSELINYHIKRNEYTTTLFVVDTEENEIYEYQFIHRIYPDMSSIIGGFDLSICMVAYDGKQIYATPLGAWSIQNKSIIVDTKRRSTSFEYRLQKYSMNGFRLIFPGISNQLIQDFNNKNSGKTEMINKMKAIAKDYGFEYNANWQDFDFVGGVLPECSSYSIQKKADILPYFKLRSHEIATPKYDRENIEDRLINKISDYSMLSSHPKCFSAINAQQLRSDNLHSVSSILKLDKNIRDQLINDINNPNLMIDNSVIAKFYDRVEMLRSPFIRKGEGHGNIENENIDFHRLIKCFGKLTPKVIEIRDTDEYYEYRDIIVDKMMTNTEICMKNLIGIKWITQTPGRQWTSSINPIIADPRQWYGKHYEPVITGIPSEIEATMRLMRLPKTESLWTTINDDVFNVICACVLYNYANDAWNYIL